MTRFILPLAVFGGLLAACTNHPIIMGDTGAYDTAPEADADTDTDADSDADSDTDADADADADSDADADADTDADTDTTPVDVDGDGWDTGAADCDDTRADIYPGAEELCDEVDNDCDGSVDEDCDDTHEVCVVAVGDGVDEWDLAILLDDDVNHWVSEDGGTAVVGDPILTEADSDDCVTFTGDRAKFNGASPDSGLWGRYLVGADNGSDSVVFSTGGFGSVLRIEVDGSTVGFCTSSYDLCWNW